ncbi:MAG: lysozyme [Prevotella sp.]|nr:lysozyme [Candidatus Prevotella equi]
MKASDILIDAIKQFEGCRLTAYQDSVGIWTIGYGHTKGVKPGDKISQYIAIDYLKQDLAVFEREVNALGVCKTQGQFDALVDFCYNLGTANLKSSTLLKKIKAKAPRAEIYAQFNKWVYAGGKKLSGLVKRRAWEAKRYFE